jgi:hypothetical protein
MSVDHADRLHGAAATPAMQKRQLVGDNAHEGDR